MKLKLYTAAGLIAIAGLVSCGGEDKDVVDKSIIPTGSDTAKAQTAVQNTATLPANTPPANTTVIPGTTATPVNMAQQMQAITPTPQNNVVMTPVQTPVQATAPGMNPPHGQPNHRCDIPVGAPLNSKPAPPATTTGTTVSAQPQVTMKEIPTTTKTAPGMNPPHGEPGHRCDIAVGAPLNSKPATPNVVTTTTAPANIAPPPLLTAPKGDSTKN